MPISSYNQIKSGLFVAIVLKADQRTGKQVQGTVAQILTRHNHPRGIKVKLTNGRVGRVQQILPQDQRPGKQSSMTSNNPWADSPSQGSPYGNGNGNSQQQSQQGQNQRYYADYNQQQNPDSYQQHDQQQQPPQQNPWSATPQQQQQFPGGFSAPQGPPPSQGMRRSDTDQLLAQEGDRAAQVEHMQQFEANAHLSQDDKNQADLQKQFPNIDSSLIAAIYNERKPDMAEVRELLQELASG